MDITVALVSVFFLNTYQDINLPCDTYQYLVRAFDLTYKSADSNISYETITDSKSPVGPTEFSFTSLVDRVAFYWTLSNDDPFSDSEEGDDDVSRYQIYAHVGESEYLLNNTASAGQTSVVIPTTVSPYILSYLNFGIKSVDL